MPVGIFGFTGQKQSFFGDLHMMAGLFIFFTESRNVTQTWFAEGTTAPGKVDTWAGTMTAPSHWDEADDGYGSTPSCRISRWKRWSERI